MTNDASATNGSGGAADTTGPGGPAGIYDNHRDLHVAGGPLRVYEAGPADAPTVLLLHGAMLDNAGVIWRHLVPELARKWHVLVPDLPRHGVSRPWRGTVDQARLEAVIDQLLDELGVERAVLVGLSFGGGVATGYALNRPERVSGLVAIGPGGIEDSRPGQFLIWLTTRSTLLMRWFLRTLDSRPRIEKYMADGHSHGRDTRDFDEMMGIIAEEVRAGIRHREGALDDWQIAMFGPRRMRVNFAPRLHRLTVPSLWLHGEHDKLPGIREHLVRRAAERAPGGRFVSIPDAGHFAPLDEPERVNAEVASFLEEVHPRNTSREPDTGPQDDGQV